MVEPDSAPTASVQPSVDTVSSHRTKGETIYLGLLIVLVFIVSVALLLLPAWSIFVPAMGISFFFGVFVATLAYVFLGSKGHDHFGMRGMQFGGAVAVVAGLIWLTNDSLERQLDLIAKIGQLTTRAETAEEKARRELVVERGVFQPIVSGGRIRLEDVNTLNGWQEGPHEENKERPGAEQIFTQLFDRLDIRRDVPQVLQMTEDQWVHFLSRLPAGKRLQLGGIPFARISIHASDGRHYQQTVFKHDVIPVLNHRDRPEAFLCIRRILDVRERRSDEAEIIVVTHSRRQCE